MKHERPGILSAIIGSLVLAAVASANSIPGDLNLDGMVNDDDFALFVGCASGPAVPHDGGELCIAADLDNDGDVDVDDFAVFQRHYRFALPPGMALIPAGEFLMGNSFSSSEGYSDELPRHAVFVSAFYMDRYEVTNQQYAQALNWARSQGGHITVTSNVVYKAGSGTSFPYCDTTSSNSSSRITWNSTTQQFGVVAGKENHPMVRVSWYGAVAYANWRSAMENRPLGYNLSTWACNFNSGYRLPTEAEWEKAARGGASGRRFPWSDSDLIQHARANYQSSSSYSYDNSPTRGTHPTFNTGSMPYTSPVGYFAPNGYGLYDMAGNVWEWCHDWYSGTYYSTTPYPHMNPRGPTSGTRRVLRGGGWTDHADWCRVATRGDGWPGLRSYVDGFRCAAGT